VILTSGALEWISAKGESQTWDEGIHIAAGYAYLSLGDFRWNQEHPPLVKLMSALPLLVLDLELPVNSESWRKLDETQLGIDLLYHSRPKADSILLAARSMNILLSLAFLLSLALLVRRRFGKAAALLAVCLCGFDPNLIANARYVTTDFPLTVFYFLAVWLWTAYLTGGRVRQLLLAALAFALAMVIKFSAILLIPTLAILYVARWWQAPAKFPWRRIVTVIATFAAVTFAIVAIVYWPETVRCWTKTVTPLSISVKRGNLLGEILYRAGRWFRLPSHAFFTGLSKVADHNASGHTSYLLGMRSDQGWWYYFLVVYAVKSTMAALLSTLLLAAAGVGLVWGARRAGLRQAISALRGASFLWFGLLIPPVVYFASSMSSAINIGMRHILPIYPFLYVGVAVLLARANWQRAARPVMFFLAALQIGECAWIAPDYLAFFNAPSGGPGNGPRYLVDSNIDWGQDVKKLKKWLTAHHTDTATVLYFGNAQMDAYGIHALDFPDALDEKGWDSLNGYAVASVTPLYGVYVPLDRVARLRFREPVAKVGWSLYVYDFRKRGGL
jgi:hypothetical protein